jgi:hypothetical protein
LPETGSEIYEVIMGCKFGLDQRNTGFVEKHAEKWVLKIQMMMV